MQTPRVMGPPIARMIAAIIAFAAILGGGVYAVLQISNIDPPSHVEQVSKIAMGPGDDSTFFYKTIGQGAPIDPQESAIESNPLERITDGAKSSYTLEIKVTSSRDEAERLIDELHSRGIEAYYTPLSRNGKVVYRVRLGIYPSHREADRAAVAINRQSAVEAKVVKLQ